MEDVLAIRPFVLAQDPALSRRFYEALGFATTHQDDQVTILKLGSFSFILQSYYLKEAAENLMVQMLVRNVDNWWTRIESQDLAATFAVKPPIPPKLQPWGLKVGFLFDPSGVLWHVAEAPF